MGPFVKLLAAGFFAGSLAVLAAFVLLFTTERNLERTVDAKCYEMGSR
jgi:hypothetical protein